MKKIWSFTTVKDEEDIIESFVRYNMNIFDGMVISDNGSNDKTLDILYKLKEEGYNIDILIDPSQYFDQLIKRNDLLKYTIEKYHPDYVIPIDADEFVCAHTKENPRKEILKLDSNVLYKYKMKNYVMNGKENESELFIPKKMTNLRVKEEEEDYNYKCIIPKGIYEQGITLWVGAHSVSLLDGTEFESQVAEKMYLAHYPVRSKYQLINKIITGRLNNSSLHAREEGFGFHQYEILDEIVKEGTISDDTLIDMSEKYSVVDKTKKFKISNSIINLKFCKNLNIKYSKPGNDDKLLSNTIKTSMAIINHMREENKKEHEEYQKQNNVYKEELDKILNSRTWRIRTRITQIFRRKEKV